jgi:hypothetical protein
MRVENLAQNMLWVLLGSLLHGAKFAVVFFEVLIIC